MRYPNLWPLYTGNSRNLEGALPREANASALGAENCRLQESVGGGTTVNLRSRKRGLLEGFTYLSLSEGHWPDRQRFRPGHSYSVLSSWNVCVGKETVEMKYVQGSICGVWRGRRTLKALLFKACALENDVTMIFLQSESTVFLQKWLSSSPAPNSE